MKERPIIFSGPMVQALLDGRKTQTRRVIKPQPDVPDGSIFKVGSDGQVWGRGPNEDVGLLQPLIHEGKVFTCPYGQPGDRLWVRETFAFSEWWDDFSPKQIAKKCLALQIGYQKPWASILYDADQATVNDDTMNRDDEWGRKRPSIQMPRWASRILLEVTEVRVQRLQDISEEDAKAEGVWPVCLGCLETLKEKICDTCGPETNPNFKRGFERVWKFIYGQDAWDRNDWVFPVSFKVLEVK